MTSTGCSGLWPKRPRWRMLPVGSPAKPRRPDSRRPAFEAHEGETFMRPVCLLSGCRRSTAASGCAYCVAVGVVRGVRRVAAACWVPRRWREAEAWLRCRRLVASPRLRRWRCASLRRVEVARGAAAAAVVASVPLARLRAASAGVALPRASTTPAASRRARNMGAGFLSTVGPFAGRSARSGARCQQCASRPGSLSQPCPATD